MSGTDELWGGSLASISFDPVVWTLEFVVEVVEHGELRRYQLVLDGVTEWSVVCDVPLPWTYAELTELQVTEIDETPGVRRDGVVERRHLADGSMHASSGRSAALVDRQLMPRD